MRWSVSAELGHFFCNFLQCVNLIRVLYVLFVQILSKELIKLYARAVQKRYFNCIPIIIRGLYQICYGWDV